MSSLVRSCMELRNIFLRGWGTLKTAAVYHARLRTAHFVVQRIACGTFLYRGCNQTKGNPKTVGFLRRFCILLPPRANMQDAGAARNRRTKNGPSGRQPLRGARPKPRETTRARGAEYLFSILPQKHKRLQRKVSFSRRGSLYLDRRRVSAPLPAACYQLSCVLYWATIRQTRICEIHIF